jgi:type IV pilus assembly protein PilW
MKTTRTYKTGRTAGRGSQQGLSLFELLISMIVLAALMAGIAELVVTNTRNANATSSLARLQETGRTAMQILASDIRRAGYLGGNAFPELITGTLGTSAPAATCAATTAWGRMLEQPVFGINDAKTGYACIVDDDNYLRGDVLTIRYTPTPALTNEEMTTAEFAEKSSDQLFLRTTLMEGRLFKGSDEADAANALDPITSRNHALAASTYFVGDSGRTCGRDAEGLEFKIPALFRKTLNDQGLPVTQELLAGVEHIQFRYKVSTVDNNRYLDAVDVLNWNRDIVSAIETSVLVRAECPEAGFSNNRTFDFGDIEGYGPEDAFRRQIFRSVTQLRN